jgi:integrase
MKDYGRHNKKVLGKRPLGEIDRTQIRTLTREMVGRGILTQTNHVHALIRQAFSYALEEELVGANPALGMAAPAPKRARERVLSDKELKLFWAALKNPASVPGVDGKPHKISKATALALRLAALLLQRRGEVATMKQTDVDLAQGTWLIPADVAKNGRPHLVPLPPEARRIIKEALAIKRRGRSPYVFAGARGCGLRSIHPDALTRAMGSLMKALELPVAGPHDLRRTGASLLASERAGVAPFVISQVLNHITDTGGGSATTRRHYNQHLYVAEKRRALGVWEDLLLEIVCERPRPESFGENALRVTGGGPAYLISLRSPKLTTDNLTQPVVAHWAWTAQVRTGA